MNAHPRGLHRHLARFSDGLAQRAHPESLTLAGGPQPAARSPQPAARRLSAPPVSLDAIAGLAPAGSAGKPGEARIVERGAVAAAARP